LHPREEDLIKKLTPEKLSKLRKDLAFLKRITKDKEVTVELDESNGVLRWFSKKRGKLICEITMPE
jgi:hypothetical protein